MVLEPLTPEELARHQQGIAKVRKQLFRIHTQAECLIVPDSERVLPASAESRWCADRGAYRVFYFGGLAYRVDAGSPDGLSKVQIKHFERDCFSFDLSSARGQTVNSLIASFRELDVLLYKRVHSHREANLRQLPRKSINAHKCE